MLLQCKYDLSLELIYHLKFQKQIASLNKSATVLLTDHSQLACNFDAILSIGYLID